jgi:hypothetical protein
LVGGEAANQPLSPFKNEKPLVIQSEAMNLNIFTGQQCKLIYK